MARVVFDPHGNPDSITTNSSYQLTAAQNIVVIQFRNNLSPIFHIPCWKKMAFSFHDNHYEIITGILHYFNQEHTSRIHFTLTC